MSGEGLLALSISDIPELGGGVTGTRDERSHIGREGEGHDVSRVARERCHLLTSLDVPQSTSHVSGGSDNLVVIEESAARQVAGMAGKLSRYSHIALASLQRVD